MCFKVLTLADIKQSGKEPVNVRLTRVVVALSRIAWTTT